MSTDKADADSPPLLIDNTFTFEDQHSCPDKGLVKQDLVEGGLSLE